MGKTKSRKSSDLHDEVDLLSDVRDNLESEISLLEDRIKEQQESLQIELDPDEGSEKDGGIYVFDEDDSIAAAFDEFFSKTDPEVDKIRDDLLNDSSRGRRFPLRSARLGE